MEKRLHLLVYISGHGLGHLAQVAPVLNMLHGRLPHLKLTLRTQIAEHLLRQRIRAEFHYLQESTDVGMLMHSALEVDVDASMAAYTEFHQDWPTRVAAEAQRLRALAPDLVMTDVAYLPLAAAAKIGVCSLSLCSLNWADIFRHYCEGCDGADRILSEIETAYAEAALFLQPLPSMPMDWLAQRRHIGPLADPGRDRRRELEAWLGITKEDRLILVSMGGIATRFSVEDWPKLPNVKWLVQSDWLGDGAREDMFAFDAMPFLFSDLLASCDLMLTKPGYGAFVEAAVTGIPVLFVRRDDWPEQVYLIEWLEAVGSCLGVDSDQVVRGDFGDELNALLLSHAPSGISPTGNEEAAGYILQLLASADQSSLRSSSMASP